MITSKQRAYLRSLANTLPAVAQVGKNGLIPSAMQTFDDVLEARELIKIHVLENSGEDPKAVLELLCRELHAEPVGTVGRKIILYRRASENPFIELP